MITLVPTVLTLVVSQGDRCLYAARSPPVCKLVAAVFAGWVGGRVSGCVCGLDWGVSGVGLGCGLGWVGFALGCGSGGAGWVGVW